MEKEFPKDPRKVLEYALKGLKDGTLKVPPPDVLFPEASKPEPDDHDIHDATELRIENRLPPIPDDHWQKVNKRFPDTF